MAVPVTVLYKIMVGNAPFPATSASSSDKTSSKKLDAKAEKGAQCPPKTDFTAVFSAIFAMVYGGTDILIGKQSPSYGVDIVSHPILAR